MAKMTMVHAHPRRPLFIMELNANLNLVLKDVFLYDIEACHYTILNNLGYDMSKIPYDDKFERNKTIGQMMRDNPRLTELLRNKTESTINEYILKNNVKEDQIVIRQYDGLILTRGLRETNVTEIPFDMRRNFEIFIMSIDRKKYIARDTKKKMSIKGVPFRYEQMDEIYKKICNINFGHKSSIFKTLFKIKNRFLESSDPNLFGIPLKNGNFNIYLKKYGEMEISAPTLRIMDTDDIDKQKYFDFYITPFTKSIVAEYVR
jgi:hypothetical protein